MHSKQRFRSVKLVFRVVRCAADFMWRRGPCEDETPVVHMAYGRTCTWALVSHATPEGAHANKLVIHNMLC